MTEPDIDLTDPIVVRPGESLVDAVREARENTVVQTIMEATEHDRSKYIGGSDIAAVMGLSPWMTPLVLWEYKTHRKQREVTPEKARIFKRGHKLEPFIREMTIDKLQDMGLKVEVVSISERFIDPSVSFFAAEIDFQLRLTGEVEIGDDVIQLDGEVVNVDAKSVTGFARKKWGDIGTDEVPIEYAAQFMWGLGLTHARYCLVAALRSFDDVDLFWIKADGETISAMRAKATQFWLEHVLLEVPPDPVNFADVKHLYEHASSLAELKVCEDEALVQKVYDLKRVKGAIKDLKEQEEVLQFEITKEIGDALGLSNGKHPLCTWANEADTRFQQKEFAAAHPALAEQFTKRGSKRVLRLKIK